MRTVFAVLALAATAVACTEQATAPLSETPQFGLVSRNDSTVKAVFIRWTEGSYEYSVDFAEGLVNGVWTARVGYWVYDTYPCYDPDWGEYTCYDLVKGGWGYVPRTDVRGGDGAMAVSTNTSQAANADFWHFNDDGGPVTITVRQVPGTQGRMHDVGRWEWGGEEWKYNSMYEGREATASGIVAGIEIPSTASAWLTRGWGHVIVKVAATERTAP